MAFVFCAPGSEAKLRTAICAAPPCVMSEVPPRITKYSELGEPPEPRGFSCRWLLGIAFAALIVLLVLIGLILVLPVILLLTAIRRIVHCYNTYHTEPKQLRIAIIGGGWSGLQCMARLRELGVKQVVGFERYDALGGTWHPNLRYHTLQIHGAMWGTSFANYPYDPHDRDIQAGKVSGEEVQEYVKRFAMEKSLNESYCLNSKVVSIRYESRKREATLVVEDEQGKRHDKGPFDFIIYASQASEPNMPELLGREAFSGKVLHSTQFKKSSFDEIVADRRKVVVVGGSKAGCDLALCFFRFGYKDFTWLYRKPYLFWKYEALFHNKSLTSRLRGITILVGALLSIMSSTVAGWLFWSSGVAVTYGKWHNDWMKFHFGILCPKQRRDLGAIPSANIAIGNPSRYLPNGLLLDDGREIEADYVIYGTGCQSGIDRIDYEKDGAPYVLKPTRKLLNYFIYPDFPVLANSTALWTTLGPVRAVNSADLAVYHLCVRRRLSEAVMERKAAWQLGGDANAISGWLFQSRTFALRTWVVTHVDLMFAGVEDFFDFLWHGMQIFLLAEQDPIKFRILPKDRNPHPYHQLREDY